MTIFIVEGAGPFPVDMLRFDRCWPASKADADAIASLSEARREIRLEFSLMNLFDQRPTAARWLWHGWQVTAHAVIPLAAKAAERELDHRGRR